MRTWRVADEIGPCVVADGDLTDDTSARQICECFRDGEPQDEDDEANARLIAAAPDLLAAWSSINADQVKMLHASGLKSVEDVRDITENQIGKIKLPNIRDLKKMAQLYLDGLGSAQAAEREAARDAEMASMREQLAAAMQLLEEQAELNAVTHGGKKPAKAPEQQAA